MDDRGSSSEPFHDDRVDQDVIDRLARFGQTGVPSATASAHLTAIAAVPARRRARWHRVRVGAAFLAGLLVGGTGLASAGALPGSAQAVAHDVLGAVGVGVPDRSTEGCPEGETFRNHGQFVSSRATKEEKQAAAKSPCGKPIGAADADAGEGGGAAADNPCRPPWAGGGKPAWAGKGLTADERAAQRESAQAEREAWRASRPAECAADEAEGSDDPDEVEETETEADETAEVEVNDDDQADEADDTDDDENSGDGGGAVPTDPNGTNPSPPAAAPADPPPAGES